MKSIQQRDNENYAASLKAQEIESKALITKTSFESLKETHIKSVSFKEKIKALEAQFFSLKEELHLAEIEKTKIDASLNGKAGYLKNQGCKKTLDYINKHGAR